jgi:hypothetical protein
MGADEACGAPKSQTRFYGFQTRIIHYLGDYCLNQPYEGSHSLIRPPLSSPQNFKVNMPWHAFELETCHRHEMAAAADLKFRVDEKLSRVE